MDVNLRTQNLKKHFHKICRTCLTESENFQEIFRIADLLKECTSIQINMNADLPKLICLDCIDKLNSAFQFRKQCELSEKTLLQLTEFHEETSVKFEYNNPNSQLNKTQNLESNEIDIKSEGSYNVNDETSVPCDEIKSIEIIIEDSKIILNDSKDINLESINNNTVNNCEDYSDNDDQPLIQRLNNENNDSILDSDCNFPNQSSDESVFIKKNKRKKNSIYKQKKAIKLIKTEDKNKNRLPCTKCKKSFDLEADLEIHMLKHQKFDDFICPKCSKSFKNLDTLKRHFNTHMINKPYKCNFCNKSFAGSGNLHRHSRVHTGEKPFVCSTCGKRYSDSSGLLAHMKYRHVGVRSFICTICSKSFIFKFELRVHMRVHTGEKPYLCNECGEGFSQSYALTKHKRKHTGERPHACAECDKTFRLKEQLKFHMRTHTGYKPHICKVCEMGFARPESLVHHNRSAHTGERPFCCNICEKSFVSSKNLSQHKRTHNKERK